MFTCRAPFICGNIFGSRVKRVNASYLQGALFTTWRNREEICFSLNDCNTLALFRMILNERIRVSMMSMAKKAFSV
jgi:hypothetical protein